MSNATAFEVGKLLEAIPDPIFIKSLSGEFVHCNSLFAGMLGVDRTRIIGAPVANVTNAEFSRVCDDVDRRMLYSNSLADRYDGLIQNEATKELFMAKLIKSLYLDDRGGPLGFICIVRSAKKNVQCTPKLSPRELEVLALVAEGMSQKEISRKLGISIHTTAHHMKAIYIKMNVRNRVAAISAANALELF